MISIVIPTLNEESVLETTLQSLQRLTLPHEIIVSDGKSTDRTVEIARRYADKVIEYAGTARQTIAQGRNAGAFAATGEFIVLIDADCTFMDPDAFFTRALGHFERNPKLVAVAGWLKVLPKSETWADWINFGITNIGNMILNDVFRIGGAQEFHMMRRSAFEKVGGYRGELVVSEDVDLYQRLAKIGRTWFDPKLVVYHTGRRAHKVGWPRLQWIWFLNTVLYKFKGKPYSKEWTVIR